jgi:hypothetical protein
MEGLSARARLAELAKEAGSPTVATTLERANVEQALGLAEGPPELILDILRRSEDQEERLQLSVEWSREDLEALLQRAQGTTVILEFDAESIERALQQAEVEPHGFREKAVILAAVAVTAAGAGSAAAIPDVGGGSADAGAAAIAPGGRATASPTGIEQATRPDDLATPRTTPAATAEGADQYGMPRAMPADYPAPEYGAPRAMPADYPAPEYGAPRAMPADYPAGDTGGGGIAIPAPSPGQATLLTGGIALLIAGAAFAATRRRERISPA